MKKWMLIGLLCFAFGCEKKAVWPVDASDPGLIVVDGMLTNEFKKHSVKLTMPVTELNGDAQAVSGAIVTISDGIRIWTMSEDDSTAGVYTSDTAFAGAAGRTYTLSIMLNGKTYTAADRMPAGSYFDPLQYARTSRDDLYRIVWVASPYSPQAAAMYEIFLDWSHVAGYEHLPPAECCATLYYFTLTTIDVSNIFSPEIEKISFPAGTLITERKYTLSAQYENFIRCLLLETDWKGGLFDAVSANLPTNVQGGGLGFFSACPVNSVSITVTP